MNFTFLPSSSVLTHSSSGTFEAPQARPQVVASIRRSAAEIADREWKVDIPENNHPTCCSRALLNSLVDIRLWRRRVCPHLDGRLRRVGYCRGPTLQIPAIAPPLPARPAQVYFCAFTRLFQIAPGARQPSLLTRRGWRYRQPLATSSSIQLSSASPSRRRDCTRSHIHLDLLWLRFLALRDAQRQHAVLIVRVDRVRVYRARQRKTPAERAIAAFDA